MMKKLTPSEQKTLIAAAVICAVFLLAWVLLYLPQVRKFNKLKNDFNTAQMRIQQIEGMISVNDNMGEAMELLKDKLNNLILKFPQTEKESLQAVSDLARKANLTVVSMQSQPKTPFLDAQGQPARVEDKNCQMINVSVELKGSFKDLGRYFSLLKTVLPAYVSIERVNLQSDGAAMPLLNISLVLNLYLLT